MATAHTTKTDDLLARDAHVLGDVLKVRFYPLAIDRVWLPAEVAASFGGADLESVFLRLAGREVPERPLERDQETERPSL